MKPGRVDSKGAKNSNTSRDSPLLPEGETPLAFVSAACPTSCVFTSPRPQKPRHRHPNSIHVGSEARGCGQLLPLHPGSLESAAPGPPGDLRVRRVGQIRGPGAALLLTWRSMGPGWGIRRVHASPRARCAPAHRCRRRGPPGPSAGSRASASWRAGAGPWPREACPVGGGSSGSRSSQWLLALPRPASAPPSSAAFLFPPLQGTGQTGFSAPGWCLPSPSGCRGRRAGLGLGRGAGPAFCPPSIPPGGGEELDGEPRSEQTPPRSSPAPSVRPGGRWRPRLKPERSPLLFWPALSSPDAPASLGTRLPPRPASLASLSHRPRSGWPPLRVGDRVSPESWRGRRSPGT